MLPTADENVILGSPLRNPYPGSQPPTPHSSSADMKSTRDPKLGRDWREYLALGIYVWGIDLVCLYYLFLGMPYLSDLHNRFVQVIKFSFGVSGSAAVYMVFFCASLAPQPTDTRLVSWLKAIDRNALMISGICGLYGFVKK
ncbi:uncharacterized protein L199_004791 [Kwoniella botswanensis]|uniref:uncharacterized protein n=1 Tax=Kwoniella botswanensis TaxID=1268659 RepID=UPI00315DCA49